MSELLIQYYEPNTVGCEVGVWQGKFSHQLYTRIKPKKLYLIDPWIVRPDYANRPYSINAINQKELDLMCQNVVEIFSNSSEVTIIRDLFENANKFIPDGSLDWIYVDGDYSETFNDLKIAFKKVKNGGYITGNNFSLFDPISQLQVVQNAVDKFLQMHTKKIKILTIHNDQYVMKKE